MACTSVSISSVAAAAKEITIGMRRSDSGNDLQRGSKIRRSSSERQLRCSLIVPKAAATSTKKMKSSNSFGVFPFNLAVPKTIKTFLFDSDNGIDRDHDDEGKRGEDLEKTVNWVERLRELRSRWRDRKQRDDGAGNEDDDYCRVDYDDNDEEEMGLMEEEEEDEGWGSEKFDKFLTKVAWSETKLFAKLAFLCNMAYVIPQIKAKDLKKYYDLHLVTSSLEKKSKAAIKANLNTDSTRIQTNLNRHPNPNLNPVESDPKPSSMQLKYPIRTSAAHETAASAASYVHSLTEDQLPLGSVPLRVGDVDGEGTRGRVYDSEVASFMVASTRTTVLAAEENARLVAAKDLRSLHSSPCEWFICDDPNTCIRCFVIQGSDSLASWRANLLFEPTKFEKIRSRILCRELMC